MNIKLIRYNHDKESTQGIMAINRDFACYALEDEYRTTKVKGETRIPEGRYEVKLKQEMTDMTKRYRKKYPWFTYHLWLQDVPGFQWIYIHVGNHDDHSDGCILIADQAQNDPKDFRSQQWSSATAFERVYKQVRQAIMDGETVTIRIKSIWGDDEEG